MGFEEVLGGCLPRVSPHVLHIAGSGQKSKGLQRQLLAEEFFNTFYKALHKKSLHIIFSYSLLSLTGCLHFALADIALWL